MPFDGRISGFGSVSGVFFGSWRTNVLVSVRSEGFRLSRSVSTPSVPVSTLAWVISLVSGVADLLSDTQCTFSTLLPRGFRLSGGVFDPLGTGFAPPSDWGFVSLGWFRHPLNLSRPSF